MYKITKNQFRFYNSYNYHWFTKNNYYIGIGAYRDEDEMPYVFNSVKIAEDIILNAQN